jgi:hypothetical protein
VPWVRINPFFDSACQTQCNLGSIEQRVFGLFYLSSSSSSSCYPLSHSINAIGPAPLRSGRNFLFVLYLHVGRVKTSPLEPLHIINIQDSALVWRCLRGSCSAQALHMLLPPRLAANSLAMASRSLAPTVI